MSQPLIFVIEDDRIMAECLARSLADLSCQVQIFHDAFAAITALTGGLPDLILLDVLLNGPDGFTFLNELISYPDTAEIPIILVTSLDIQAKNLAHYGVRGIISKDTMTPASLCAAVQRVLAPEQLSVSVPPTPQVSMCDAHFLAEKGN